MGSWLSSSEIEPAFIRNNLFLLFSQQTKRSPLSVPLFFRRKLGIALQVQSYFWRGIGFCRDVIQLCVYRLYICICRLSINPHTGSQFYKCLSHIWFTAFRTQSKMLLGIHVSFAHVELTGLLPQSYINHTQTKSFWSSVVTDRLQVVYTRKRSLQQVDTEPSSVGRALFWVVVRWFWLYVQDRLGGAESPWGLLLPEGRVSSIAPLSWDIRTL